MSISTRNVSLLRNCSASGTETKISNQAKHKYRVSADQKLPVGKHTITFDFNYDGGGIGKGGTGTLSVDGKKVAESNFPQTVAYRFSLDETFDVGEDTGTPVVEDYADRMPFKFNGTLHKVTIELGKSGLSAGDEKALSEATGKIAAVRD